MKIFKKVAIILMAIMLIAAFAACSSGEETSETSAAVSESQSVEETTSVVSPEGDYQFAIIVPTTENEYFLYEINRLESSLNAAGYELSVISYNSDTEQQVAAVENAITMGIDAALIFPMDAESIDAACGEAMQAGMKIISGGVELENMNCLYNVNQSETGQAMSEMAANYITANYGDEAIEVAMITNTSTTSMVDRTNGMIDKLTEMCPNVAIAKQIEGSSTEDGMVAAENILQSNPNVKVIIAINDTTGLGAVEALKAGGATDVAVFGCDATEQGLSAIAEGGLFKGTIKFAEMDLSQYLIKLAKGEEVDEWLAPDTIQITEANIADYVS